MFPYRNYGGDQCGEYPPLELPSYILDVLFSSNSAFNITSSPISYKWIKSSVYGTGYTHSCYKSSSWWGVTLRLSLCVYDAHTILVWASHGKTISQNFYGRFDNTVCLQDFRSSPPPKNLWYEIKIGKNLPTGDYYLFLRRVVSRRPKFLPRPCQWSSPHSQIFSLQKSFLWNKLIKWHKPSLFIHLHGEEGNDPTAQ